MTTGADKAVQIEGRSASPRFIRDDGGKRAWVRRALTPGLTYDLVGERDGYDLLIEVRTGAYVAVAKGGVR